MLVTIGTPHANNFTAEYVIGLAATLVQAPYPIEVRHNEGSFIYFNRNLIFNRAEGDYLMFMVFISAILAVSVHWFLGVASFIIAYAYIVEA